MSSNRTSLDTVYKVRDKWTLEYIDFDGKHHRKILKKEDGTYPANKTQARRIADGVMQKIRNAQSIRSDIEYLHRFAESQQLIQRLLISLDDVWPLVANTPKIKNGTRVRNREYQWNKFRTWLAEHYPAIKSPHEITPAMAQAFINELYSEGMANSTFNDYVTSYRLFFKIIIANGGMNSNPFENIERLRNNTISHRPIPREYIQKILDACDNPQFKVMQMRKNENITPAELKTLIMVGLYSGLRLKDCALLQWEAINFDRDMIKVVAYKTRKFKSTPLIIPMMPALRKYLLAIRGENSSGAVMPLIAKRYIGDNANAVAEDIPVNSDGGKISKEVTNLFKFVGLISEEEATYTRRKHNPNIYGFHSFRHYFISTCAKNNIPSSYVEAIIGDGSNIIKEYYTHINEEDMMHSLCNIQSEFEVQVSPCNTIAV